MREKFDKYWGTPNKINKMIFISCVLDHRHKFIWVGFALQLTFGKEETSILEKGVRDYMELLFDEYAKSLSKDKAFQMCPFISHGGVAFWTSSLLLLAILFLCLHLVPCDAPSWSAPPLPFEKQI